MKTSKPRLKDTTSSVAGLTRFYWHCEVAARIISELQTNAATQSNSRHAVRMATLDLLGNEGVRYASAKARRIQRESGKPWHKCGLVREHAIAVSELHKRIVSRLRRSMTHAQKATASARLRKDMERHGLPPETIDEFPLSPLAWRVVEVLRKWTHLAWVTPEEDKLLKARLKDGGESLNRRMPEDWDKKNCLARYEACKIRVRAI